LRTPYRVLAGHYHKVMGTRTAANALGKLWASPSTLIGLVLGMLGWVGSRGPWPRVANNAIELYGNRLVGLFTPAITLGNAIIYADANPPAATQEHERQHTYQAEVLGPAYIPLHIIFQLVAFAYSFWDRSRAYRGMNDRVHSPANLLEAGPSDEMPRPWWW
jgi:hypothetical protein